jgi:soluble lytic murein transglycosylase-like protein
VKRTILLWIAILIAALWVNGTFAKSSVPSFVDGAWVMPASNVPTVSDEVWTMPARPVHSTMMQYSGYGGGWEQHAIEACAVYGCDPNYLLSIAACESNFDETAAAYNPSSGNMTLGLMQIDEMWGSIAYAGGVEQLWWAAAHLGEVWWACG